jgi:hypothetical protein
LMRRPLLLTALIAVIICVLMAGTGLADPTIPLGNYSVASSQDNDAAGLAEAFNYTASASDSAQSISVYVDSGSSASGLAVGLYADNSGHPGSLLTSGSMSAPVAGQWNQVTLNSTATLSSGTTYWLAVLGTGGQLNFRDVNFGTGSCSENSSQSDLMSLPSNWTSGATWTTCSLSAYVNGTASSTTTSAPANTALPTIGGSAVQAQTLSATNGSWNGSPTAYAYQWQDCDSSGNNCTDITGATSASYVLGSGDVGDSVRVVVTATNAAGSTSASSAQTAAVAASPPPAPSNTALPTITGTTTQGQTLSTSNGSWSGSPTSYTYQWQDCTSTTCQNISGATTTTSTYTLQASDVGSTIDVTVTATNSGGSASVSSAQTSIVQAAPQLLLGDQTAQSVDDGSSAPASEAFGYTASQSGTATSASVYLTSTDGATIGVYSDSSSHPGTLLDKGSVPSNTAGWTIVPLNGGVGIVSGTRYWLAIGANSGGNVGYRDSSSSGSNLDFSGTGFASPYSSNGQWSSNPASVYVTGPVGPPPPPPPPSAPANTVSPTISGAPQQGNSLTVNNGTWTGTTPITYSYKWQDCTSSACTNISGATSSSYTLQASEVGDTIDVVVTATNSVSSTSATSAKTVVASGLYALPSDRTFAWNPGLNAVGGILARTTISKTISPSGGDDTATIQAALNNCPTNGVVMLNAGVFHISGQGLFIENSNCTLRGVGPGPGNWPRGQAPTGTGGTYLVKPTGTNYPVVTMGPQWGWGGGTATNLTTDAVKGTNSVTVASTAGLTAGNLVIVNELTDPNISHWNTTDPENNSGWFE